MTLADTKPRTTKNASLSKGEDQGVKFLLLVPSLSSVGGMQRCSRQMIKAMDTFFAQRGDRLIVFSLNDSNSEPMHDDLKELNVTRVTSFNADRFRFGLSALGSFLQVDCVIYGLLGFTPLAFLQRVLCPFSTRYLLIFGFEAWRRRGNVHDWAVHQMNGVISISNYTKERYRQEYQIPESQSSFVLPLSVGWRQNVPMLSSQETFSVDNQNLLILSVARLVGEERYKGIDTVIQALPALLEEFPSLRYTIIGDGPDRPRLENLAAQLDVCQAIEFRGAVSDTELEKEYSNCTLFAMPSGAEGFGLVYIEAMANAKPVVAARAGGAPEVVEDGVTGILVEYGNVPEIVAALRTLLSDKSRRTKMGEAGRARFLSQFTYPEFYARFSKILSEIATGRNP